MENCIITKLKGTVDNSSLKKLGVIALPTKNVGTSDSNCILELRGETTVTVTALDGAYFTLSKADLSDDTKWKTEYTLSNTNKKTLYVGNAVGKIEISNKYDLYAIGSTYSTYDSNNNYSFDISQVESCTSLTNLSAISKDCYGDISKLNKLSLVTFHAGSNIYGSINGLDFSDTVTFDIGVGKSSDKVTGVTDTFLSTTNLTSFIVQYRTAFVGDIANIGGNTGLTNVNIIGSGVSGSVEGFVEAQVAAGRTSVDNPFKLFGAFKKLTFGGSKVASTTNYCFIMWSDSGAKIVMPYGSTSAANCTKMYVKGYTDEEVATNTAPGGIWEGRTVTIIQDADASTATENS